MSRFRAIFHTSIKSREIAHARRGELDERLESGVRGRGIYTSTESHHMHSRLRAPTPSPLALRRPLLSRKSSPAPSPSPLDPTRAERTGRNARTGTDAPNAHTQRTRRRTRTRSTPTVDDAQIERTHVTDMRRYRSTSTYFGESTSILQGQDAFTVLAEGSREQIGVFVTSVPSSRRTPRM